MIEIYWATGVACPQPHAAPIDLARPEAELLHAVTLLNPAQPEADLLHAVALLEGRDGSPAPATRISQKGGEAPLPRESLPYVSTGTLRRAALTEHGI
jgi:hypothetical protein